jgi:enoyl-CoA hydratase/carnithine racemase
MGNGSVVCSIGQGIATITFGHPQSNSLPGIILNQLAEEITSIGANLEVRVIVLKSLGEKTFCGKNNVFWRRRKMKGIRGIPILQSVESQPQVI